MMGAGVGTMLTTGLTRTAIGTLVVPDAEPAPKITLGCRRLRFGEISRAFKMAAASTAYENTATAAVSGALSNPRIQSHSAWGIAAETSPIARIFHRCAGLRTDNPMK